MITYWEKPVSVNNTRKKLKFFGILFLLKACNTSKAPERSRQMSEQWRVLLGWENMENNS